MVSNRAALNILHFLNGSDDISWVGVEFLTHSLDNRPGEDIGWCAFNPSGGDDLGGISLWPSTKKNTANRQ